MFLKKIILRIKMVVKFGVPDFILFHSYACNKMSITTLFSKGNIELKGGLKK